MFSFFQLFVKVPNFKQLRNIMRSDFMIDGQLIFNIFTDSNHDHKLYSDPKTGLLLVFCHS